MSPLLFIRVSLVMLLVVWSFLDYGFVRGSYGAVLPGFWHLPVILLLTFLLMIPSVVFLPLWILPHLLQKWKGSIHESTSRCRDCGHSLEAADDICPECGPLTEENGPPERTLLLSCLAIWLGCWMCGSIAGEFIARMDEHSFIRAHETSMPSPYSRERWKPYWGSLHWDDQSNSPFATLHED